MELLDLVDERGEPTGETVERDEAHRLGLRHRVAHVWVVRLKAGHWEVLLQKRSRNKDSYPGLWDTSSAGHIPAGCAPLPSALRELEEELSIRAAEADLTPIGQFPIRYEAEFHGRVFRDNEVSQVYVYDQPVELSSLRLQAEEIEAADWFALDALRRCVAAGDARFCVPEAALGLLESHLNKEAHT